jgi:hypothetical protein
MEAAEGSADLPQVRSQRARRAADVA